MTVHRYESREDFWNAAHKAIVQTDSVLDIGPWIRPQTLISPVVHICCEPYAEYAQKILQKNPKTKEFVVLNVGWQQAMDIFPDASVDTVITMDVIEHLTKSEGIELLKRTVKKARRQVVIFTPLGFMPQEAPEGMKDGWWLSGAEWQKHKSGWLPEDFWEDWEIFVCENFHFFDAITGEKFEKPYGAMFAILQKPNTGHWHLHSIARHLASFVLVTLPLYIKSNPYIYNPLLKKTYRKILSLMNGNDQS